MRSSGRFGASQQSLAARPLHATVVTGYSVTVPAGSPTHRRAVLRIAIEDRSDRVGAVCLRHRLSFGASYQSFGLAPGGIRLPVACRSGCVTALLVLSDVNYAGTHRTLQQVSSFTPSHCI